MERLEKLRPQERGACLIAERVLGAVATPWDVDGRNGAVDAILELSDGRRAAFEVTALAAPGALQIDGVLHQDDNSWPLPGKWWWAIRVGSPRDIPRLRKVFGKIALICEAADVADPRSLVQCEESDVDVLWLVEESSSRMFGHPDIPAEDGTQVRTAMVVSTGRAGRVVDSLAGLRAALEVVFNEPPFPRHFAKLAKVDADERHLFVPIHWSALPFEILDNIVMREDLPPDPPPLPREVSHLWLAPEYSRRVLLWGPEGWSSHKPYDN